MWNTPQGVAVAWTRMGEGNIGIEDYVREYAAKCPGRPLSLEIIVTGPRVVQLSRSQILGRVPQDSGLGIRALPGAGRQRQAARGSAAAFREAAAAQELADVEASIRWTKAFLEKM